MAENKDRYKYFRIEARELLEGLSQGALELDRGNRGKDIVARILRLAHTLKGAARVVKLADIAQLAHSIEDALATYRDRPEQIPQECINEILGFVDASGAKVAALDLQRVEDTKAKSRPMLEEFSETVRVEIEEADNLLEGISETALHLTALERDVSANDQARRLVDRLRESLAVGPGNEVNVAGVAVANVKIQSLVEELDGHLEHLDRSMTAGIDRVKTELVQVRDAANRLRLLPASRIFSPLDRAIRDAAQTLQKNVLFSAEGGELRLETHVLAALQSALLHVVRNAVAHGIELPAERIATGKTAQGRVELRVERRGSRIAFICRDDGRGIDVQAVREVAVKRGVIAPKDAASLGLDEVVRMLMKGGVSTSSTVDAVSGRGIGLDVVRETTMRLKGEVKVESERGQGTSVEMLVPVSLSSLAALEFEAGGAFASLPLDSISGVLRITEHDIARSHSKESIVHDGKVIPFMALATALNVHAETDRKRRTWPAIVVKAPSGLVAIGVDQLLGAATVVVRSLPSSAPAAPFVTGASLDAEGNPQLVLDPEGLLDAARLGRTPAAVEKEAAKPTPVLVIDDSLTTRMLEQNILESAGYEVDVATSGEAGLAKAKEKQYGLFLVDVEMPGIDGFEFVSRTQLDHALRAIPSILVTSRSAVEDKRRGELVGARAYITKGEFDQGHLLETIRQLIG